ncbi:MAG: biotin transporter BioY [Dehalococcoidia bacterium]|jgi:biotin transporter BioY
MNQTNTQTATLIDAVIPGSGILRDVALIAGFACITAICAQVSFWIGPVPVTGQTLGVIMAGALLGSRRGALSQLSYLVIGATGLPFWFALGGPVGIARLIGPTAGYLYGFVAAAFIIGWLMENGWGRKVYKIIPAMLLGEISLYACGLAWLAAFVPSGSLLQSGLYPFIIGDLVKIALATAALPAGWAVIERINKTVT